MERRQGRHRRAQVPGLNGGAVVCNHPSKVLNCRHGRRSHGPVLGGLGMLLHQAVRGFELWFGVTPEVTQELYDLVAADVQKAHKQ